MSNVTVEVCVGRVQEGKMEEKRDGGQWEVVVNWQSLQQIAADHQK